MNWLPFQKEIQLSTLKMVFSVAKSQVPEELSLQIPLNNNGHGVQQHTTFQPSLGGLTHNSLNKNSLHIRLYFYNTLPKELTTNIELKKLKLSLKSYIQNQNS